MGAPVVHWQMLVKDPDKTAAFYTAVFGWRVDADNAMGYRRVETGGAASLDGGIWPAPPEGHNLVQLFIGVESIAASVASAVAHGAKTIIPPQHLPDGDEVAIMVDPLGMPFGLVARARVSNPSM
jgi:predicted enzyme related to lactoylglutathione lyase